MVAVHPDRVFDAYDSVPVGAPDFVTALNASTSSFARVGVASTKQGYLLIGLATPSGLTDDYRWVRGEVRCAYRGYQYAGAGFFAADATGSTNPNFLLVNVRTPLTGPSGWADQPGALWGSERRFICGPRSFFVNSVFRAFAGAVGSGPSSAPGLYDPVEINDFRFEIHDYVDPPTATVVGPAGAVTITTVNGVEGIPAAWTFTSPPGFVYAGFRLAVATQPDGTGIIYTTAGGPVTTTMIPSWALAGFLAEQLYVVVQVAHTVPGGYLAPDPATGLTQWGPPTAPVQFTPTGAITVTFGARRPDTWIDDLDDADRRILTDTHRPTFAAELYQWDGLRSWPLHLIAGSVTLDATNQVRAVCDITVADHDLRPPAAYPMDPARPLHPFGSYVQLARGVGDTLVSLGAFVIETVEVDETIAGPSEVTVTGSDWSRFVADARFTYMKVRQDFTGAEYVTDLVTDVLAAVVTEAGLTPVINGESSDRVALNTVQRFTDVRPDVLDDLCRSIGWWWWADPHGRIIFQPAPAITDPVRYRFREGVGCTVTRHGSVLSRDAMFDTAVAYDPAGLYVAGAFDQNPLSPVFRGDADPDTPWLGSGQFGPGGKPTFLSSPLITSPSSAAATAATLFARTAVPAETVDLDVVPVPDLRPGHVFTLERAGRALTTWIVSATTIPLGVTDPQTVTGFLPADWKQVTTS